MCHCQIFLCVHADIGIISMRETEMFQGNTMQSPGRENFSYRKKGNDSAKVNWASIFHCATQGLLPSSDCIHSDMYSLKHTFSPNWSVLAKCFCGDLQFLYSLSAEQVNRCNASKTWFSCILPLHRPFFSSHPPALSQLAQDLFRHLSGPSILTHWKSRKWSRKKLNMFYVMLER